MRSRPARMSDQKPRESDEPGKSALTPTTAMGICRGEAADILVNLKS